MKAYLKIILILIIITLLASCNNSNHEADTNAVNNMRDIPDGFYQLEYEETIIYPTEERIFASNPTIGKVGYYDLINGMAYTPLTADGESVPADVIYADESAVYLYGDNCITVLDYSGNVISSWETDDVEANVQENFLSHLVYLCADDDTVLLVHILCTDSLRQTSYITTIDRSSGEVITTPQDDPTVTHIKSIKPERDGFILIGFTEETDSDSVAVLRYQPSNDSMKSLYNCTDHAYFDYFAENIYAFDNTSHVLQLFQITDEGTESNLLRNLDANALAKGAGAVMGTDDKTYIADTFFMLGNDFLLFDKRSSVLAVSDTASLASGQTLNVYYPVVVGFDMNTDFEDITYEMLRFEEDYDCAVRAKTYPVKEYADRLRMKLLAGDEDMDVIYLDHCDESDLLSAILRYQLYLPLEDYSTITENYENFADGVRDVMTYDGHLIGVPHSFETGSLVFTEVYQSLGLPMLSKNWTIDDFWNICEQSLPYVGNGTALTQSNKIWWMIEVLVEDGYRTGRMDEEKIRDTVTKIKHYSDLGVLAWPGQANEYLIWGGANLPYTPGSSGGEWNIADVLPRPMIDGNRYAALGSLVFVYAKSQNKEAAVDYMSMLSSEEFAYMTGVYKTYFMKDISGYYRINDRYEVSMYATEKVNIELSEKDENLMSRTSSLLPGTQLYTIVSAETNTVFWDIFERLFADEITAYEAADEIIAHAKYRYQE